MGNDWTPWFAWLMDLVKFAITFTVGALITLGVIDRVQQARAKHHKLEDAVFQLQLSSLQEFRRATANYEVAAHSAYADLYQWVGKEKTVTMQWYEGAAYGEFRAALDEMKNRFSHDGTVVALVTRLSEAHKGRHRLYDYWVDKRLDGDPDTPISPRRNRTEFDRLLKEATELRLSLARAVEHEMLPAPA